MNNQLDFYDHVIKLITYETLETINQMLSSEQFSRCDIWKLKTNLLSLQNNINKKHEVKYAHQSIQM